MLYYEGLEEVIFSKHEFGSEVPDEIVIISGYLGPAPIERLAELPMKATVIGGMYSGGIDQRLLDSLNKAMANNPNLTILYCERDIHSKIYIWKRKGKILYALIGSANFSSNGLRTDYRESLADATRDTYSPLETYYKFICDNSSQTPKIGKKKEVIDFSEFKLNKEVSYSDKKYSIDIPLYTMVSGVKSIAGSSGLNWGRARLTSNAHVAEGDAYIRLPKEILKHSEGLIKPFDMDYLTPTGKRKRQSDPIELIWDDGTVMAASLEGTQQLDGKTYPKQLASYSSKTPTKDGKRISKKSILGRYLRERLNVGVDDEITMDILEEYGRDTITLSLIEEGVYYADFSVQKK